jgi:hypothetical protein
MWYKIIMSKKILNLIVTISLVLPLFAGMFGPCGIACTFSSFIQIFLKSNIQTHFEEPCDMDDCNPNLPKCPLCPSSSSLNPYLPNEAGIYLPTLSSPFKPISVDSLADQGFVQSIFHPPTWLL